jgi:hypothetical protein
VEPVLSLIVSCSRIRRQVKQFIDQISATQSVSRFELFLLTWDGHDYLSLVTAPFHSKHQIEFNPRIGINQIRAKAVAMATGRIVVFLEDHVRVEGDLAEVLIPHLDSEKYCAVGWTVKPGNATSKVSWAGYLVEYSCWGPALKSGEIEHVPGHNCAYKRDALVSLGSELPSLLRAESIIHWKLRKEGKRIFFTSEIVLFHNQFHSLAKFLISDFWYAWNFADTRQKAFYWKLPRRWLYAFAFPLIPFVRWKRLVSIANDRFLPRRILWKCFPLITLSFIFSSLGEAMGYLFGAHHAPVKLSYMELAFDRL